MSIVEQTWHIEHKPENQEYPFALVRTDADGTRMWFGCHTVEEAHGKLQAIAVVLDEMGHQMDIV